jgi:hypothetical protein
MRKFVTTLTLALATVSVAQAAIINVTKANYRVIAVHAGKTEFDVDLVQNAGKPDKEMLHHTLVHLNHDCRCHIVHPGHPLENVSNARLIQFVHHGTHVRVTGGRTLSGNIDASEVWAER